MKVRIGAVITLAAVMLVDYVVVKRRQIDLPALFDPNGRYRYLNGVNVAAFVAIASGVALYYALPQSWLKIAWGLGAAAVVYLVCVRVLARTRFPAGATLRRT